MRRFYLLREEDESGVSGTGHVASGVQFADGQCVMRWNTESTSTAIYHSVEDVETIHGHGGKTRVWFLDEQGHAGKDVRDHTPTGLCVCCLGGPYDNNDGSPGLYHRCFECGANKAVVYVPRWAVKDLRKRDKLHADNVSTYHRELRLLRGLLPPPDFLHVEKVLPPTAEDELEWWSRNAPLDYFDVSWKVGIGNTSAVVRADSEEEARVKGAVALSWLPGYPDDSKAV